MSRGFRRGVQNKGPRSGGVERGPTKRGLREARSRQRAGQQGENPDSDHPQSQDLSYYLIPVAPMNGLQPLRPFTGLWNVKAPSATGTLKRWPESLTVVRLFWASITVHSCSSRPAGPLEDAAEPSGIGPTSRFLGARGRSSRDLESLRRTLAI